MRDVFFGEGETGKNYAVLCHDENSKIPVSSVFQDAHNDGSSKAEFRLVNCDYVLPSSEKTIAERFKFNMKDRPIMFVSGAIGEPKQVRRKGDERLAHNFLNQITHDTQPFPTNRFPPNT